MLHCSDKRRNMKKDENAGRRSDQYIVLNRVSSPSSIKQLICSTPSTLSPLQCKKHSSEHSCGSPAGDSPRLRHHRLLLSRILKQRDKLQSRGHRRLQYLCEPVLDVSHLGRLTWNKWLCVAGGIGVTPALAFLAELVMARSLTFQMPLKRLEAKT